MSDVKIEFKIEFWRQTKERIYQINSQNEEEYLPDYRNTLKLIQEVQQKQFDQQINEDYFYNDFLPEIVRYLLMNKSYRLKECMELHDQIVLESFQMYCKKINDDPYKLSEMFKNTLDLQKGYYRYNNLLEDDNYMLGQNLQYDYDRDLWLSKLQKDDLVDAVKIDRLNMNQCWSHAQITSISNNNIKILFLNESSDQIRMLKSSSFHIQPYESQFHDLTWRMSLQVDDIVDAVDDNNVWIKSTIINLKKSDDDIIMAQIAFRTFDENGKKTDQNGKKFTGWSQKYDTWFNVLSPRIQKPLKMSRKFCSQSNQNNEDNIIDDSQDLLYENLQFKKYAIIRPSICKSLTLVSLVNQIGNMGLFDKILERLEDTQNWCPIEIASNLIAGIGNISQILYRDFCQSYIPRLFNAIRNNILKSPESNIRNFTSEKIELIWNSLENLLKRYYSLDEKNFMVEEFMIQTALICFNSKFLDKKIQGVKTISDVIRNVKIGFFKQLTQDYISKWLKSSSIFSNIFDNQNAHCQIIQRSEYILKFILQTDQLEYSDWKVIVETIQKTDNETKLAIYKILSEIAQDFKEQDCIILLENLFIKIKIESIIFEDVKLSYEIARFKLNDSEIQKTITQFYRNLICNESIVNQEIIEFCVQKLCDMVKKEKKNELKQQLQKDCYQNLQFDQNFESNKNYLKILKQIYEYELYDEDIGVIVLQNIQRYKQSINQEKININYYVSMISQRVDFIKAISEKNNERVEQFINTLWNELIESALFEQEKDLMFKFLQNVPEQYFDIFKFFTSKFENNQTLIKNLSLEGFQWFKSFFQSVNSEKQNLIVEKITQNVQPEINKYFSVMSEQQSYSCQEIILKSNITPAQMIGITFLWNLVFECQNMDVLESAIQLLTSLYLNLTEKMEPLNVAIKKEFLDACILHLQKNDHQNILRSFKILNCIVNESEKNGAGGLKSHSQLDVGESIKLNIQNEIQSSMNVTKKFEVKIQSNETIYDLKVKIGKIIKNGWNAIKLSRPNLSNKEIQDRNNMRTLQDLRIKNGEVLIINSKPVPYIQQVDLIDNNGSLVPAFLAIINIWFETYSENKKMSTNHCAQFINSCTNDNCDAQDTRVQNIFKQWDRDNDGFLDLDDFIAIYYQSAQEKPNIVWMNLHAHGYKNDLTCLNEIQNQEIDINQQPRFLISQSNQNYDILFNLLNYPQEISDEAWSFLKRLPSSQDIMNRILTVENYENESFWNEIFSINFKYKLFYNLQIIDNLLNQTLEKNEREVNQGDQSKLQIKYVQQNGFLRLKSIFKQLQELNQPSNLDVNILNLIIKLYKNYYTASSDYPHIFKIMTSIKLSSFNLDLLKQGVTQQDLSQQPYNQVSDKRLLILSQRLQIPQQHKDLYDLLQENNLRQKLMEQLYDEDFIHKLIRMMIKTTQTEEIESIDKILIENSIGILLCVFMSYDQKEIFNKYMPEILDYGLFNKTQVVIRQQYKIFLFMCASLQKDQYLKMIIQYLLQNIPDQSDPKRKECNQYFELLCTLLLELDHLQVESIGIDYKQLMLKVIRVLLQYKSMEKRDSVHNDKILIGFLNLTERLIFLMPELANYFETDFLLKFFNNFLFLDPLKIVQNNNNETEILEIENDINYVKCKTYDSRRAAYRLLTTLCKNFKQNINELLQNGIMQVLNYVPLNYSWAYQPSFEVKSMHGYVGIRNLGCICYMNAMLQQFYMTKEFRYAILTANDQIEDKFIKIEKKGQTYIVDDNILHQIQRMFSYLELSDRQDYNPYGFCLAFKDFSGNPVDVSIQQDAQEFLNMIFDKLENSLKQTPFKQILEKIYGGKQCTQLKCSTCNQLKSNYEPFFNLSLEVKNKKNLDESFEKFIQGEVIQDYFCENCQKKVETTKRCVLSSLPDVFIIHLQRIVYDYDIYENTKINTRLEFPQQLNVEPYTEEYLFRNQQKSQELNENYLYKLKGVVVHTGTAAYGHYYSYINSEGDKWLEFNDSIIKEFNVNQLENECFGGQSSSSDDWGMYKNSRDNSKNAYILVYERIKKQINENTQNYDNQVDIYKLKNDKSIRQKFQSLVWMDNHQYMLEKHIYNNDFFAFLKNLSNQIDFSSNPPLESVELVLHICTKTLFDILSRSNENSCIMDYVNVINSCIKAYPQLVELYVQLNFLNDMHKMVNLLLVCPDKTVRNAVESIVTQVVCTWIDSFEIVKLDNGQFSPQNTLIVFLNSLLQLLYYEVQVNWQKYEQYFQFWMNFASHSSKCLEYLFEKQFISLLIDFFLQRNSFLKTEKRVVMGNRFTSCNFDIVIQIISYMLKFAKNSSYHLKVSPYLISNQNHFELSQNDKISLQANAFYEKSLIENHNIMSLNLIIQNQAYESESFSINITQIILWGLRNSMVDDYKGFIDAAGYLVSIDDSIQIKRFEWIFGFPQPLMEFSQNQQRQLDKITYNYNTTSMSHSQSILQILINTRFNYEISAKILVSFLQVLNNNDNLFNYILDLPPPSAIEANFLDWIKLSIESYTRQSSKNNQSKQELIQELQEIYNQFLPKYEQKLFSKKTNVQNEGIRVFNLKETLKSLHPNFIYGKILEKHIVDEILIHEQDGQLIYLLVQDYEMIYTNSYPTGSDNLAIPKEIKNNQMTLNLNMVHPDSNIFQLYDCYNVEVSEESDVKPLMLDTDSEDELSVSFKPIIKDKIKVDIDIKHKIIARQYILNNDSNNQILFKLNFNILNDNKNARVPQTSLQVISNQNTQQTVVTLQKIDPQYEWPDIQPNFQLQVLKTYHQNTINEA